MSLTSLGLASEGLLDRGFSPTLHIGVLGHLRGGVVVDDDSSGGGSASSSPRRLTPLSKPERQRLHRAKRRLKGEARKTVDAITPELIDVGALEAAIIDALRDIPDLEPRESIAGFGKAPRIDIPLGDIVKEQREVFDDIRWRLLMLGD